MRTTDQPAEREHRIVQAAAGEALGSDGHRRRATGRLGGLIGRDDPIAELFLARTLGEDAQLLDGGENSRNLVVDWDCCRQGDTAITSLEQWRALLDSSDIAAVQGAFALAGLSPDGTLVLARDAIGERTLFYAPLPDGLLFASTLRALLATGLVPRSFNLPAVAAYLCYAYVPGRETLVRSVYEVLPGEMVVYRNGELSRSHFWSLPAEEPLQTSEDELRQMLRDRLETAVRRRLPEGEVVGAFLSGGLDSSLVVALARRLHDAPVKTFSVSFGPGHANELPFSSLVADHCGTEHRIVELSPPVVLRYLDETIGLLSDPIGDPLTVPNALLFREAAAEVGVVLNGEGGDPCFGGPKNLPMLLSELYGENSDPLARERCYLRAHLKCFDDLDVAVAPAVKEALSVSPLEERLSPLFDDPRWRNFVTKLQAINITLKGAHHILPKVDAISALFGVVARSPLFDRDVVELSLAIPPQLKLRGSVEKYLLKEAVRDLLPREIVDRPKSGMLAPVEAWFQGPLLPAARERLLDGLTTYGLVQRRYLERLLDGRLGGLRPRHGAKIWLLVTLEAWLRTVFDYRP
jgi:asparagine synthase (glutamine-hydrolysing)